MLGGVDQVSPHETRPPRQPSGIELAQSAAGPGFNPQSRTASSIAQWYSASLECWRSRVQSPVKVRVLYSLVVQCWLRVLEVLGSIPSQEPPGQQPSGRVLASIARGPWFIPSQETRHTKDAIKMVPVLPLFSTEHSKGKILALSQELRQENKCNG